MVTDAVETFRHARYEAGPVLGRGSQGAVLRVRDREDPARALVAKVYRAGVLSEDALRGEFALLARLRAPSLVRAHDLGCNEIDAAPFLVEDLIDGPDACAWLKQSEAERVPRLSQLLCGTARALVALHEAGFLHGDLKPAHVRVASGLPVLLDLGAASRWTAGEGPRVFTHAYAAPEVRAGGRCDARADLFGLGALAWAAATGSPPPAQPSALRAHAAWVPPRLAELVESLLAAHPEDRPASALAVLAALGQALNLEGSLPRPIGRERQLAAAISGERARVRYLVGPSGSGKTHVLRELHVALLLLRRPVRWLSVHEASAEQLSSWAAFLRGAAGMPIACEAGAAAPLLLLDSLDDAPRELADAVESYRARVAPAAIEVLAAARTPPGQAACIELGPMSVAELSGLGRALGAREADLERLALGAAGSPGWLVATLGRVPLHAEAVLARARGLAPASVKLLAAVAAVGGTARIAWLEAVVDKPAKVASELLAAGLLRRTQTETGLVYELEASAASADIARALAAPQLTAALSQSLQADVTAPAAAFLALAALMQGGTRSALLSAAAAAARSVHARDSEIDALLWLGEDPGERSYALLSRLERLLRDAGRQKEHERVVAWLDASAHDSRLLALALRRRAEQKAREGDQTRALALAEHARSAAEALGDPLFQALALATQGAVQLYAAQHAGAFAALIEARSRLDGLPAFDDREELARLDHNLGVVAVYRGELDQAIARFGDALRVKQQLGDRAGVRACLRNLGYALLRAGRLDEAAPLMQEALALARGLRQAAGLAWSLVCLAELEARRGNRELAEGYVVEAEALGGQVPAAVRADAALVRAELALQAGSAAAVERVLADIDPESRAADAQVDASVLIMFARAALTLAPASPLRAARAALAALRRARSGSLVIAAREAEQWLHKALRARHAVATRQRVTASPWQTIEALCAAELDSLPELLAKHALHALEAERVFVVAYRGSEPAMPFGLDCDGLAISDAAKRIDALALRAQLPGPGSPALRSVLAGGRGARLTFSSQEIQPGTLLALVAEHRFVRDAFSEVAAQTLRELQALACLVLRLQLSAAAEAPKPAGIEQAASESRPRSMTSLASAESTAAPFRASPRQFPSIVGSSRALRAALSKLDAAIDSELPLLITGETGVGKELFARALCEVGPRAGRAFVAVNCGAIPATLFEAELFGHERGAFTGADRRRAGLLAQAQGGVLLLDEVGELGLPQQVALLRALETRRMRAVGSDAERGFDVRIVAATNRDLARAVAERTFRQDLLYRLNVLEIRVPSLAERADDIEVLALHHLRAAGSRQELSAAARAALVAYAWPGNVRELAHIMQRLSTLGIERIEPAHLPRHIRGSGERRHAGARAAPRARSPSAGASRNSTGSGDARAEVLAALAQTGHNISQAARVLGLTRHGLKKRMLRLGLRARAERGQA